MRFLEWKQVAQYTWARTAPGDLSYIEVIAEVSVGRSVSGGETLYYPFYQGEDFTGHPRLLDAMDALDKRLVELGHVLEGESPYAIREPEIEVPRVSRFERGDVL